MNNKTLIKTDKNGTKHYQVVSTCPKCGGRGVISFYSHVDAGRCFECNGDGVVQYIEKEYTKEYEEKRTKKAQEKQDKIRAELIEKSYENNQRFFENNGFNTDGNTYVILGDTYDLKDELKELGGKYTNLIGWHLPYNPEAYDTVEINVNDIYFKDYTETYKWQNWKNCEEETFSIKIKEATERLYKPSSSEHQGEIGKRYKDVQMSVEQIACFDSIYGLTYIYKLLDSNNNIYIWKTSSPFEAGNYEVSYTVKAHNEYKGENQTEITRCKLSK